MCVWCQTGKTRKPCSDCEFHPSLCQTVEKDCHAEWPCQVVMNEEGCGKSGRCIVLDDLHANDAPLR